jgi:DNA-binding HxlR family transcriptional regulator
LPQSGNSLENNNKTKYSEKNIIRIFTNIKKKVVSLQKFFKTMAKENLTKEQEQLARFAKALGHPIRVAILQMLAKQTCCYHGDMSEILPVAKSTLSQHLNELKDAGLIQGTITLPSVKYCINNKNWSLARKMFETLLSEINNEDCC